MKHTHTHVPIGLSFKCHLIRDLSPWAHDAKPRCGVASGSQSSRNGEIHFDILGVSISGGTPRKDFF